ncbi:DUF6415 family natural product biosynthesis protein [Streptomyces sp. NBC_01268]|uniref:DUF6415 family natural product biosynthesis protein n=1 Tax=Streptomyces sp. NBC_01268 TaxID=2903806 RepID=UPI002E32A4EF|nr:DUF6415 family natural product biosynthesis protein [Streptomyces sp. NBC_01268]
MDEQPQHDRPTDTTEVVLGPLVVELADAVECQIEEDARRDVSYALGLRHRPDSVALADLTDRLLTHCIALAPFIELIPEAERPQRGTAALTAWARLREAGPEDGPRGNWSYARGLAVAAHDMVEALRERRRTARTARFVGRETLPPVAADTP